MNHLSLVFFPRIQKNACTSVHRVVASSLLIGKECVLPNIDALGRPSVQGNLAGEFEVSWDSQATEPLTPKP